MTDAFTKYIELVALADKEAETTGEAIFNKWICRYGTPRRSCQTKEKSSGTNWQLNYTKDWTSTTQSQLPITLSAASRGMQQDNCKILKLVCG
jgi:hypothetical protein